MTTTTTAAPPRGRLRFGARHPVLAPRALLGAVLVAAAVVGTFVAAGGGEAPQPPPRVVAARALTPGEVLSPADLTTTAADLGAADGTAFADPQLLDGAVVLAPLVDGELVQRSAVSLRDEATPPGAAQLTLALDRHRALGGRLHPGEVVDVVATLGTGDGAETDVVAGDVTVVRVEAADDALGGTSVAVTLAPADEDAALAVVHAVEVGAVVLVRPAGPR